MGNRFKTKERLFEFNCWSVWICCAAYYSPKGKGYDHPPTSKPQPLATFQYSYLLQTKIIVRALIAREQWNKNWGKRSRGRGDKKSMNIWSIFQAENRSESGGSCAFQTVRT